MFTLVLLQLSDVRNNLAGLSSLEWLDLYSNSLDEFPLSPAHLLTMKKLDVANNYVNVEEALDYVSFVISPNV